MVLMVPSPRVCCLIFNWQHGKIINCKLASLMLMTVPYTLSNWRIKLYLSTLWAFSEADLLWLPKGALCAESTRFYDVFQSQQPNISFWDFSGKLPSSRWPRECTVLWLPPEPPAALCKNTCCHLSHLSTLPLTVPEFCLVEHSQLLPRRQDQHHIIFLEMFGA